MDRKSYNWDNIFKSGIYLAGLLLIFFLIRYLSVYLVPFFLAIITAFILNPLVRFIKYRLRLRSRVLSVVITLLLIASLIFGLVKGVGPLIGSEVKSANKLLSAYVQKETRHDNVPDFVYEQIQGWLWNPEFQDLLSQENIEKYAPEVLTGLWEGVSGLAGMLLSLFVVFTYFLYLLFILIYYDDFAYNWQRIIPPLYRRNAIMLVGDMEHEMKLYFRGQSKIVLLLCILFATGFKIIGLPLGIVLGIFVGILNFVPYLQTAGIPIGLLLAGLAALQNGTSYWQEAGLVLLVFLAVQAIQEAILIPKIMGDTTGMNPAIILLSLTIWGGLLGLVGMLIAIPITSIIIKYYKLFILHEGPTVPVRYKSKLKK